MLVEKILFNGNIITMDREQPQAQAVAIADGRFVAVGQDQEILALRNDNTELIDLEGQTVIPGLGDSHMHLFNLGSAMETVDLSPARSQEDITRIGREFLSQHPGLTWISGWGWNHDRFADGQMPTRADLDLISTELPIFFSRTCGHIAVANSRALELAGIGTNPEQPEGGQIDLDADGVPTGVLRESALGLVRRLAPKPTVADYKRMLRAGAEQAVSYGLTSVHSDDLAGRMEEMLQAYQELIEEDSLPLRVTLQVRVYTPEQIDEFLELRQRFQFPAHTVQYGPIKVMTDGSLGGRTAALNAPYADDPTTSGVEVLSQETVTRILSYAHQQGLQMSGHAIGDRAIEMLLNAFAAALAEKPQADARPRVIHAQLTTPEILKRCQELGVVCDIQPVFVGTDLHIVEQRIGKERMQTTYAWKTMRKLGIPTAGGSDSPVETCNPLVGIQQAVTRQDMSGFPEGGWLPEEKLTIEEALELFTLGPAFSAFNEATRGSISVGKLADCVVLDQDLTTVAPEEIASVKVQATYVGGRRRY
ncbi:MAG: amidohydrolase [Firmicutes bacterium]|nr:amidohydrolase [Bacillota bacterium]